jgi:hypothetical protein
MYDVVRDVRKLVFMKIKSILDAFSLMISNWDYYIA